MHYVVYYVDILLLLLFFVVVVSIVSIHIDVVALELL
jgi:hypothetical protein